MFVNDINLKFVEAQWGIVYVCSFNFEACGGSVVYC